MIRVSLFRVAWLLAILPLPVLAASPLTAPDDALLGVYPNQTVAWEAVPDLSADAPVSGISVAHLGGRRLLMKIDFKERPNFQLADLKLYLGLPELHPGRALVSVIRASLSNYSVTAAEKDEDAGAARMVQLDRSLWVAYDAPEKLSFKEGQPILTTLRVHYRPYYKGEEYRWRSPRPLRLSAQAESPRTVSAPKTTLILPEREYRQIVGRQKTDERRFTATLGTAYEAASNKGIRASELPPLRAFEVGRPFPGLRTHLPQPSGDVGAGSLAGVSTSLAIDHPTGGRQCYLPVKGGIPLPRGGCFDTACVVLRQGETQVPLAATARSRWPDGSIRWLGLDFTLPPGEAPLQLHFTSEPALLSSAQVKVTREGKRLRVENGMLQVAVHPERFYPLESVTFNGKAVPLGKKGIVMEDEAGELYSSAGRPPEHLEIEEESAALVVLRAEGRLVSERGREGMGYVARFFFRAGSPLMEMEWTTVNTMLAQEFTDVRRVFWSLLEEGSVVSVRYSAPGAEASEPLSGVTLRQWSDKVAAINGEKKEAQMNGALQIRTAEGALGVVVRDFWQRYPKGMDAGKGGLVLEWLPALPKALPELPFYAAFPYVGQGYRMKWGMAFTERVLIDFSGQVEPKDLSAMGQLYPVPKLDPRWVAASGAVRVSADHSALTQKWDAYFATLFDDHIERQLSQRTYGFLNYGDWYGERGRNWGNNEYDTAHAFFQQYLRSGDSRAYRSALAAARHQADVDIIHAYPDPFYVGGNYIHGIAHTGTTSHYPRHGIWSQDYGLGAWAWNGHSWSEGMSKAWLLAGDRPAAEAALLLGEHLRWAVAPHCEPIPSSPRHAGWAIRVACDLYEVFGDEEYLNAAHLLLKKAGVGQGEHGGFLFPLYGGPEGNSIFMHGILLSGLGRYHSITQNPQALDIMQKIAGFLRRSWHGYWPYMVTAEGVPHPKREDTRLPELNLLTAEGLAYLGAMTGDDDAARLAREAAEEQLSAPPPKATGQKVGNSLRAGVETLYWLERGEVSRRAVEPSLQTPSSSTSLGAEGMPR